MLQNNFRKTDEESRHIVETGFLAALKCQSANDGHNLAFDGAVISTLVQFL